MNTSKWDNLPNEILDQIINALGKEIPITTKWIMVNKQWFEWYQSIKYKNIIVSCSNKHLLKHNLLKNIIHSNFQPGVYVKSIAFQTRLFPASTQKEEDRSKLFLSSFIAGVNDVDIIYLLMKKCPNVKHVTFPSSIMNRQNWIHFLTALKTCDAWKLQSLSDNHSRIREHDDRCNRSYFHCLYHLRNNLRNITVNYWMMNSESYKFFTQFKQLRKVTVVNNVLHNMKETCNLVDHLVTGVEELEVDFMGFASCSTKNVDPVPEKWKSSIGQLGTKEMKKEKRVIATNNTKYPNIRKLTLQYLPADSTKTDDIQLIKRFNNLRHTSISINGLLRSSSDHNTTFLQSRTFKHILSSAAAYDVSITVEEDEALFFFKNYCLSLKEWLKTSNNNRGSTINSDNSQLYINSLYLPQHQQITRQTMTINPKRKTVNGVGALEIHFGLPRLITQDDAAAKINLILNHKNNVIDAVHYNLQKKDQIGLLLYGNNLISNLTFEKCAKISITNGTLHHDSSPLPHQHATTINHSNIQHLQFESSRIDFHALPDLSRCLPKMMKRIEFHDCTFEEGLQHQLENDDSGEEALNPYLSFPNTDIDTLVLSASLEDNTHSPIAKNKALFIMVTLTEENTTKGYICTGSDSSKPSTKETIVTETSKEIIDALIDMMTVNDVEGSFIKLEVKSLQTLLVDVKRKNGIQFNIKITFPNLSIVIPLSP